MIRVFYLVASLLFYFNSLAQTPKVEYYILEDSSLRLSAEEVFMNFKNGAFAKQSSEQFNPGFTKSVYWLAVIIDSGENADSLRLMIGQPVINKIDFYQVETDAPKLIWKTGDHYVYAQRPLPTVEYVFPLSNKAHFYFLRVDKHHESLQLTFSIKPITDFIATETNNTIITGILSGIILLLLVFGVYLTIITRQKIYILYLLYIIAGWFWVLSDLGYGFKYFWSNSVWFASRSRPLFASLTIAFSMQYLIYYLGDIRIRWLKRSLLLTSYFGLFLSVLWLLPVNVYEAKSFSMLILILLPVMVALYIIFTLTTLVIEAVHRNIMAIFYMVALIPILLLTVIYILNHSGIISISGSFIEHFGVPVGYASEAVILTFGLAYRFNNYRLEKEQLNIAFERQQKENAKALIDTEAKERRRIADELHDIAGSMLSAARLNISSLREKEIVNDVDAKIKLEKADEALSIVAGSVRNLSHALSPIMLDKIGFKKAIENIASFFNSSGKIYIEAVVVGFNGYNPKNESIYTTLYSIVYELMNNIAKHSKATNAIIQVIEHEESITLTAEDNGIGLKEVNTNSIGLSGIISKINYFNGTIEFDSNNTGLIISIEIPINHEN